MFTHKILLWIWGLMALFTLSLIQSVAEIIPPATARYYFFAVYALTGLFVIILISGGFKIKPDGISRSFGYTSPDTSVGVIARILPWTAVLLFSIVTITLNENINYLSAGNLAGLTTVFVVANAFFAILLFRGSFTVET